MIELVLIFLLGVLTAGLVWLLLLPAVWRRVERLTRERIERALPLNTNEILAERDRERASSAVQRLALEARIEAMQREVVSAKGEVGHQVSREAALLDTIAGFEARQVQQAAKINALEAQAAERGAAIARLTQTCEIAKAEAERLEGERADLVARLAEAQLQLESERRLRDESEVHLQSARQAEGEARARALALREELLARNHGVRGSEQRQVN